MPDGETCTLDGAQVNGNVKVGIGSTLMTADAMIKGNVFGQQAMRVHIIDTDVWGQIHFRRTAKEIIIGNDGCKVVPNAGGNINLQNNYGPIGICQMTIKNNIILHNNHNRIGVFDNRVGNNIEVMSNTSAAIRLRDNTVMGGLLIKGNTVAKVLNVSTNTIGGNANCTMNVVAPTGSGNTAGGALSGQVRGPGLIWERECRAQGALCRTFCTTFVATWAGPVRVLGDVPRARPAGRASAAIGRELPPAGPGLAPRRGVPKRGPQR